MGKLVNVVLWDGRTVSLPEDQAAAITGAATGREETAGEAEQRARSAQVASEHTGVVDTALTAGEGALDTLSLGGYGKLVNAISPDTGQEMREAAQVHPYARDIGEAGALLVPGAGEVAGLGAVGKAGEIGEAVGGTLGARVAEGALYGIGGDIAQSNVTGDPLTIEGAITSAGFGALFNVGVGAVADKLRGSVANANTAIAAEDAARKDAQVVAEHGKLFDDQPPSYEDFRQSWIAKQKATAQYNKKIAQQAADYTDFYSSSKLGTAADKTQDVINSLQKDRYASASASRNIQYIEGKPRAVLYTYERAPGTITSADAAGAADGLVERQILVPSKPPVSDDYVARLREYQRRMSRIYKLQSGGYAIDNSGNWIKDATVQADPRRALEELRAIQTDLKAEFPKASNSLGKWGDLPDLPPDQLPQVDVSVPKSLREFARKRPETINALAQNLDEPTSRAFYQLVDDLGLEPHPDGIAATVDSVHRTLGDYVAASDRLEAYAADTAAKEAKKPWLIRMLNKSIRYAASRYFDVGGVLGAATRAAGGEAVGGALGRIEDSVLGAGLLSSKQGVSRAIRDVVAKYGNGAAGGIEKLGPVTAWLAHRFPDGAKDSTTDDPRQLAVRRANDIAALQPIAPDMAFSSLQPLMGAPGDVAFKLHQQLVNGINHLAMTAPKDPGLNTTMFGSNWTPSWQDAIALAHRLEAIQSPISAITRALTGGGHPAAAETLWANYPAIMQELALEFSSQADSLHVSYERGSAISRLLRIPVTGLQQPAVIAALQGMHLPQIQQGPQSNGAGLGSRTPQPTGRPAAVQSSVAGSDVSGLISQA